MFFSSKNSISWKYAILTSGPKPSVHWTHGTEKNSVQKGNICCGKQSIWKSVTLRASVGKTNGNILRPLHLRRWLKCIHKFKSRGPIIITFVVWNNTFKIVYNFYPCNFMFRSLKAFTARVLFKVIATTIVHFHVLVCCLDDTYEWNTFSAPVLSVFAKCAETSNEASCWSFVWGLTKRVAFMRLGWDFWLECWFLCSEYHSWPVEGFCRQLNK